MGLLLAVAVGYALGARAGHRGFDELVASIKTIRDSEEFHAMLAAARSHAGHVLQEAADLLGHKAGAPILEDLVPRVSAMTEKLPTRPSF